MRCERENEMKRTGDRRERWGAKEKEVQVEVERREVHNERGRREKWQKRPQSERGRFRTMAADDRAIRKRANKEKQQQGVLEEKAGQHVHCVTCNSDTCANNVETT